MNLFSPYAKAYATLIGTTASALLGVFAADTPVGKVLTVVAVICTVLATFTIPNAKVVKVGGDDGDDSDPVIVTGSTPEEVEEALDENPDAPVHPNHLTPDHSAPEVPLSEQVSGNTGAPMWGDHLRTSKSKNFPYGA